MALGTSQGPHRKENQDRSAIAEIKFGKGLTENMRVAVMCDGMGGLLDGGEAATFALSAFVCSLLFRTQKRLADAMSEAMVYANKKVFASFNGKSGTTLTAVCMTSNETIAAHAGDSRLYSVLPGTDLKLITQDDTIQGAVLAHQGQVNEDQLDNRLLQFVGIGQGFAPHILKLTPGAGEFWLLTSDGAHGIGKRSLDGIVERVRDPNDLVRKVIFIAEAINVKDNASVLCINNDHFLSSAALTNGTTLSLWSPYDHLEIWLSPTSLHRSNDSKIKMVQVKNVPQEMGGQTHDNSDNILAISGDLPKKDGKRESEKRTKRSKRLQDKNQGQIEVTFEPEISNDD